LPIPLRAQVPQVLTYQGRVTSGGTNFSGDGQFKFALVGGRTTTAATASGSATVSFGFVVHIAVTSGGNGYTAAPVVSIADASGTGAAAVAQISNGQVVSITVTDAGSGYSASPTITIAPPAVTLSYATYWSHDGTSSAGGEPVSAISVSVSEGLFTVGLGDTLIPNMSALAPQMLANADVRLRIWFNDGVNGFSQLSPDQRLTSAAYAMMADTVRDGAITGAKLAPSSITSFQIAPGSITASQLADGAVTRLKLASDVKLEAPLGSIVMSADADDTNLVAGGFERVHGVRTPNLELDWKAHQVPQTIPIYDRGVSVWTGTDLVVWSSQSLENQAIVHSGTRYNPSTGVWLQISTSGGPTQDFEAERALWTGTEMIIQNWNDPTQGLIYNPTSDSWRSMNSSNSPSSDYFVAGREIFAWDYELSAIARYNLDTDLWTRGVSLQGLSEDVDCTWTGSEVIALDDLGNGGRYDPKSNSWRPTNRTNAPTNVINLLWVGSKLLAFSSTGVSLYEPSTDKWVTSKLGSVYRGETQCRAQFVGTEMGALILNGSTLTRFDLSSDSWTSSPAYGGCAGFVWTGREVFLCGGNQVVSLRPPLQKDSMPLYLYRKK
jgi:hypothetical protein